MPSSVGKSGWASVTFGEMAEHVAERVEPTPADGPTYVGLEHLDSGSLTVRRWGAEVALIGTKLRMRKGDILFARRNAYLRRVALAPHDGLFSAHGMVLRARQGVVLPTFLPFFMQSDVFMERAKEISVGSLSPTINWNTLAKEKFLIPPAQEQRQLAQVLRAVEDALDSVLATGSAVESVRDSLCVSLLSRNSGCSARPIRSLLSQSRAGLWGDEAGVNEVDVNVLTSTGLDNQGTLHVGASAVRSIPSAG